MTYQNDITYTPLAPPRPERPSSPGSPCPRAPPKAPPRRCAGSLRPGDLRKVPGRRGGPGAGMDGGWPGSPVKEFLFYTNLASGN